MLKGELIRGKTEHLAEGELNHQKWKGAVKMGTCPLSVETFTKSDKGTLASQKGKERYKDGKGH